MEKLYQQDPFLTRFTAEVVSCAADKGGWSVVLDRTAFYPEGGRAALGHRYAERHPSHPGPGAGWAVVVHTCAARLEPGTQVEGGCRLGAALRPDAAALREHIVSGLIHSTYGYDNVGFHLGSDLVTIDFNGSLEEEDLRDIELRANQYIWEDRPVSVTYPTTKELAALDYRSKRRSLGRSALSPSLGRTPAPAAGPMWHPPDRWGWSSFSVQKFREGRAGGAALRRPGPELSGSGAGPEPADLQSAFRQAL